MGDAPPTSQLPDSKQQLILASQCDGSDTDTNVHGAVIPRGAVITHTVTSKTPKNTQFQKLIPTTPYATGRRGLFK